MGKWYEEAVFYHMYPLGMTGAPFENREETTVHRFEELKKWLPHIEELGCTAAVSYTHLDVYKRPGIILYK